MSDSNRAVPPAEGAGARVTAGGSQEAAAAFPAPLRNLRFSLDAQLARGRMTVDQLMRLAPGSIVASGLNGALSSAMRPASRRE